MQSLVWRRKIRGHLAPVHLGKLALNSCVCVQLCACTVINYRWRSRRNCFSCTRSTIYTCACQSLCNK